MLKYAGLPESENRMPAEPFYLQIMADIRRRIATGEWPPGHKLPPSPALTAMYREQIGVSAIATVRRAVEKLIESGELRSHPGLGVYVAEHE